MTLVLMELLEINVSEKIEINFFDLKGQCKTVGQTGLLKDLDRKFLLLFVALCQTKQVKLSELIRSGKLYYVIFWYVVHRMRKKTLGVVKERELKEKTFNLTNI